MKSDFTSESFKKKILHNYFFPQLDDWMLLKELRKLSEKGKWTEEKVSKETVVLLQWESKTG